MKKTILVTGSSGYVGGIITKYLKNKYSIHGLNSKDCNLTNEDEVFNLAKKNSPDVIIHAAGNKDIKFCEANPKKAYGANELSVINLVKAFPNKKIIYISSDYVFEGDKGGYNEENEPRPKTVYGKSKLAGEEYGLKNSDNFIILRSSAIFDEKASFPTFLNQELKNKHGVKCFINTFYSPTYYEDFLSALIKIIDNNIKKGVYHVCGKKISRYDFCAAYAKIFNFDKKLIKKSFTDTSHWFLFPDLSMVNKKTNEILGIKTTGLEKALKKIKKKNENNQTI